MEQLEIKNGDYCRVIAGSHKGKEGVVRDLKHGKTGHISITVEQTGNLRFKTLGRNVERINL